LIIKYIDKNLIFKIINMTDCNLKDSLGYVNTDYLETVGEQLKKFKNMSYDLMHIEPGDTVLDLGCGPATDTLSLAQLVGKTGKVVGVDYDEEMVALANQKAKIAGVSNYVTHEKYDAGALPYADKTFDSCRCERVLQHLVNPKQALNELIRVTKPGGWIVILDTDWGSVAYHSSMPDIEAKIHNAYHNKGSLNPLMGRQLYQMMCEADLDLVKTQPIIFSSHDYETMSYMTLLESKFKVMGLQGGFFTQEEYDQFIIDLKKLDTKGHFFGYICGFMSYGQKTFYQA
jgi:ubiquinone/menaquinone biosynthesis C-methylase UbiE